MAENQNIGSVSIEVRLDKSKLAGDFTDLKRQIQEVAPVGVGGGKGGAGKGIGIPGIAGGDILGGLVTGVVAGDIIGKKSAPFDVEDKAREKIKQITEAFNNEFDESIKLIDNSASSEMEELEKHMQEKWDNVIAPRIKAIKEDVNDLFASTNKKESKGFLDDITKSIQSFGGGPIAGIKGLLDLLPGAIKTVGILTLALAGLGYQFIKQFKEIDIRMTRLKYDLILLKDTIGRTLLNAFPITEMFDKWANLVEKVNKFLVDNERSISTFGHWISELIEVMREGGAFGYAVKHLREGIGSLFSKNTWSAPMDKVKELWKYLTGQNPLKDFEKSLQNIRFLGAEQLFQATQERAFTTTKYGGNEDKQTLLTKLTAESNVILERILGAVKHTSSVFGN
jgi:gas vesicle protein